MNSGCVSQELDSSVPLSCTFPPELLCVLCECVCLCVCAQECICVCACVHAHVHLCLKQDKSVCLCICINVCVTDNINLVKKVNKVTTFALLLIKDRV